jgi:hypothetical protein
MNALLRGLFGVFIVTILSCLPAVAADTPAGFRLTVELRDGSRVIGLSKDASFVFRSAILGELILPLQKIRAVEAGAGTNFFKLTTAGGDALQVGFDMENIRVATTYGTVGLPTAMIKSVRVSPASGAVGRPMDGLIGLWSGEGNAVDSVAGNNGTLVNAGFTDGVVGKAFSFAPDSFPYGTYTGVQIPDRPAYALTKSLTVECWIRPRGTGNAIFWRGDHRPGLDPYVMAMGNRATVGFSVCAEDNSLAGVQVPVGLGSWIHVAGVLDDSAGTLSLYTNGVLAAQTNTDVRPFGVLQPDQSPGVGIGNVNDGGNNFPFIGDIDEVGLYDRALSEAEVNAIYAEHAADAGSRADPLPPRTFPRMPVRAWPGGINSDRPATGFSQW